MISIKSSKVTVDSNAINNFEMKTGLVFTKEYVEFLNKHNGGKPEPNIIKIDSDEIGSFSISSFFGINETTDEDLSTQYNLLNGRIPDNCIPIARAEGGNIVCLNLGFEQKGHVFLWDHDVELLYNGKITVTDLYLISSSFNKFMEKIEQYDQEQDDLSYYEFEEVWVDPEFLKQLEDQEE